MGIRMEKKQIIIQQHICIDHEDMDNQMILLFTVDHKIIGISIVAFPPWFVFWDEKFKYYPFCYN
jgi:hypothetical protein